MKPEIVGIQ